MMQVAAALLVLFHQLPDSFMPPAIHSVCMHCIPTCNYISATSLLSDSMSAVEWATARHVLSVFRAALAPEVAARNGLTVMALAAAVAEYWFAGPVVGELVLQTQYCVSTRLVRVHSCSAACCVTGEPKHWHHGIHLCTLH